MRKLWLIWIFLVAARPAVIDRVDITVGSRAITELQLEEELSVTAFINHAAISNDPDDRRAAAHRLIQQTLIAREMRLAQFPSPEESAIDRALDRVKNDYGTLSAYRKALERYGFRQDTLRAHLGRQIATLKFIEYRFRPELNISNSEVEQEYDREIETSTLNHSGQPIASFDDSRERIKAKMIESRTDRALDNWLAQTETQARIVFVEADLAPLADKSGEAR